MKIYNVWYLLKEGFKSIFQHGFMSFAAVTVIIACLIITGSFSLLAYNVSSLITRAEDENELYAFVEDSLSDTEALALARRIRAEQVGAIFTEPQYSPAAAETIARETGAKIYTLDPIVTGESTPDAADDYINKMKQNMATLKQALQ